MKLLLLVFLTTTISLRSSGQDKFELSLPTKVAERFTKEQVPTKYSVSGRVNPFFQRADLDGDGRADYAVLVQDSTTKEESIALVLTSQAKILFSARKGRPFDGWEVLAKDTKLETGRKLKYESLVIKFGGPGFVMTWNGHDFDSLPWGE